MNRKHISKKISPDFKEKSKCAICLTERTFTREIEDKYDLKSTVKVYPKFFTDWCYKRTYYMKCTKKPENSHLKILKTKNGRLQSKCAELYNQNKLNVDLKSQDLWKNKKQNDYWVI